MDIEATGRSIRTRRHALGFSQRDVAEIAGVSLHTFGNIEAGTGNPTLRVLLAVLDALGLSMSLAIAEPTGRAVRKQAPQDAPVCVERRAVVLRHGLRAGLLTATHDGSFQFAYDPDYLANGGRAVSRTLPVQRAPFQALRLFPFFTGLVAEGSLRKLQQRILHIDSRDVFGLLIETGIDPVGNVSVVPL